MSLVLSRVLYDASVIIVVVVIYYKYVLNVFRNTIILKIASIARQIFGTFRRISVADLENLITMACSVVLQIGLLLLLAALTSFEIKQLMPQTFELSIMLYAVGLGIGEMALASFLSMTAMKALISLSPSSPRRMDDWIALVNSGWMRLFMRSMQLLPRHLSLLIIIPYIAIEELIYRGLVMSVFQPAGDGIAVAASVAIFSGYQVINMPSWRSAMFPFIGAFTMGIIHGVLFVLMPNVWPLVVAHVVFFLCVAASVNV